MRFLTQTTLVIILLLGGPRAWSDEGIGEFDIPPVIPMTPVQMQTLRHLIATDAEAAAVAQGVIAQAMPLLDAEPHPVEIIHYEGLVNTDPKRIAAIENLRDMADAARLLRCWQATDDARAKATLKNFIYSWSTTYRPTGNDVNENKLYPLLVAYLALRNDFETGPRALIDAWVGQMGELHFQAVRDSDRLTNRYTKSVRLTAIAGQVLENERWKRGVRGAIERFVEQSLYPDGRSYDLKHRDTLTYHCSALRPMIELAILAGDAGPEIYRWESAEGASLKRSTDYVVPFATGQQTRQEWLHTEVELDRQRAAAGLEAYRPGRLFDPQSALELMQAASCFDAELLGVVNQLTNSQTKRFPTWQTLVYTAVRNPSDK